MKLLIVAAAAALTISEEENPTVDQLVSLPDELAEFSEDNLTEEDHARLNAAKMKSACWKIRKQWNKYKSYGSYIRHRMKNMVGAKYTRYSSSGYLYTKSLRNWCHYYGVNIGF